MLQEFLKRLGALTGRTYTKEEFKQILMEAVDMEDELEMIEEKNEEIAELNAKLRALEEANAAPIAVDEDVKEEEKAAEPKEDNKKEKKSKN